VIANAAVEVVPGKLYGLGGIIELDERVSWVPPGTRGYEPLLSYLLLEGDQALLVDTGTGCHRDVILAQLRDLLPADAELTIALTRAEFDNALNLQEIVKAYPGTRVMGQSRVFTSFLATDPAYQVDARVDQPAVPGEPIELSPTRQLRVFYAPVRVNATVWFHDVQTGVLFSSDSFGHVHLAQADESVIVDAARDRTTEADVRRHLLTKFDWLAEADISETLAALEALFQEIEVAAIAPNRGCILMGPELVKRHLELLAGVLRGIGSRAPSTLGAAS
jgi:flavorubredoxin